MVCGKPTRPGPGLRVLRDSRSRKRSGPGLQPALPSNLAFGQNVICATESAAVQRVVSESAQEVGPHSLGQLSQELAGGGGKSAVALLSIGMISTMALSCVSIVPLPKLALGAAAALAAISLNPGSA